MNRQLAQKVVAVWRGIIFKGAAILGLLYLPPILARDYCRNAIIDWIPAVAFAALIAMLVTWWAR